MPSQPRTPSTRIRRPYASQACNICKSKKTKCSGDKPVCSSCAATGQDCAWSPDNARRPNNTQVLKKEVQYWKTQYKDLETYTKSINGYLAQRGDLLNDNFLYVGERPKFPDEGDDSEWSDDSDENRTAERLRALKLVDSDLLLYGPTSIFQYSPKSSGRVSRFPEIVENPDRRYILLGTDADMNNNPNYNPDFDWHRHLPPDMPLTRREHDKVLGLLFKFFTPWCLRIVPALFLRDMCRALSLPRGQTPEKTTHYSAMLHNAIVALATAFSDESLVRDIKSRTCYANEAKKYIDDECQSPSISVVHALSLLGSFHSAQGEQTLGYIYFGMSGRVSQALGLNIDASPWVEANVITQNDILDRNWTYWTTFSLDVCWSLYIGREFCVSPPSNRNTIPVPFVDTDFDDLPFHYPPSGVAPQPNHLSRTFAKTCELLRIARGIMDVVSVLNSPDTRNNVNHELIVQIDARLKAWKVALPQEVDITDANQHKATPHRLMLHLVYWQLFILLHRPFYRRTRPSAGLEKDIDHVTFCDTAAQKIMELISTWKCLYTLRYVPITFIQVVSSAGTIFVLSAVQATSQSQSIEDQLSQAEQCSVYLHEIGRSWQCANRAATILRNVLQEHLKPKLLRVAIQNRQKQSVSTSETPSGQVGSPVTLYDPHEGTSLVLSFPDPPPFDWPPTGIPARSPMVVDLSEATTHMNGIFRGYRRMDSDFDPQMGLGMQSGETLPSRMFMPFGPGTQPSSSRPMWNNSEPEFMNVDLLNRFDELPEYGMPS